MPEDQESAIPSIASAKAEADTRRWIERAVIGLNLCPFAKGVYQKRQVHFAVYPHHSDDGVIDALLDEARGLASLAASERDTTLLIVPNTLHDFMLFDDCARRAEKALRRAGHEGELQLATFHPDYEFADCAPDDIANATNRSPYPTLHLLREESVERATDAYPEAQAIFERNIETLRTLGHAGWQSLNVGTREDPESSQ